MTSGIFIQRLVQSLPPKLKVTVLTPSPYRAVEREGIHPYRLVCFRYAPSGWQKLAHEPGGIPEALRENRWLILLVPLLLLAMFVACIREARHCDLVHANWSVCGVVAGLVGLLLRKPVVTTLRGTDVTRAQESRVFMLMLRLCLMLNRNVVTVSQSMHVMISAAFPGHAHKVRFLPNGIEPALLDAPIEKAQPRSLLRILSIGNLVPNKGMDCFIRALARLSPPGDFEAAIIGDGPEAGRLKTLAGSLGIEAKTRFGGRVSPDRIQDFFMGADLFVLASHSEGRPNVVLEAMSAGVPVIATNIPGIAEVIEDGKTGLLFPPGDDGQLAQRIMHVSTDPDLRHVLAVRARQYIVDNGLLWPLTGQKYADLYSSIAAGSGRQ